MVKLSPRLRRRLAKLAKFVGIKRQLQPGDPNPRFVGNIDAVPLIAGPRRKKPKAPVIEKETIEREVAFFPSAVQTVEQQMTITCQVDGSLRCEALIAPDGTEIKKTITFADLSKTRAWSGYPWQNGIIRLEKNPLLVPLKAVGSRSDCGQYWRLYNTPHVEKGIENPALAVSSAPWRIEAADLPPWAEGDPEEELRRDRHHAYAQRVWWEWTRADAEANVWTLIQDIMRTAPKVGFYLGELVAEPRMFKLPGDDAPREYWVPLIPEWRAPWTRFQWLTQNGKLVAVVLDNSAAADSTGKPGQFLVAIEMEKLLHVRARAVGDDPEGRAHMRGAVNIIDGYQRKNDIELLAIEGDGAGTRQLTSTVERPLTPDEITEASAHLSNYEAANMPWYIPPPGAKLEVVSPNASLPELTGSINRDERSIGYALGDSADIVARQTHGSFGALEEANKDRDAPVTETALSYFARPVSAQVLGRFTRWNFPEDEAEGKIYSSRIVAGVIERTNVSQSIENIATAVKDGLLSNPDTRMPTAKLLDLDLDPLPEPLAPAEGEAADELPPPTLEPSRQELLTVAEAANVLRVSPSTIRKLIASGELKRAGSVGGRSRLRIEDVEQYLSDEPDPAEIEESVEGVEDPGAEVEA